MSCPKEDAADFAAGNPGDALDWICNMTPLEAIVYVRDHPTVPPPVPKPPFTPPPGFKLVLKGYTAGHGDQRSHWVVEIDS
ncbi:MAG: hypothetical protein V3S98_06180 [Dehalococcoidia bacterium]